MKLQLATNPPVQQKKQTITEQESDQDGQSIGKKWARQVPPLKSIARFAGVEELRAHLPRLERERDSWWKGTWTPRFFIGVETFNNNEHSFKELRIMQRAEYLSM